MSGNDLQERKIQAGETRAIVFLIVHRQALIEIVRRKKISQEIDRSAMQPGRAKTQPVRWSSALDSGSLLFRQNILQILKNDSHQIMFLSVFVSQIRLLNDQGGSMMMMMMISIGMCSVVGRIGMHTSKTGRWRWRNLRQERKIQGDVMFVRRENSQEVQFHRDVRGGVCQLPVSDFQIELKESEGETHAILLRPTHFFAINFDQTEDEGSVHQRKAIVEKERQGVVQLGQMKFPIDAIALTLMLPIEKIANDQPEQGRDVFAEVIGEAMSTIDLEAIRRM